MADSRNFPIRFGWRCAIGQTIHGHIKCNGSEWGFQGIRGVKKIVYHTWYPKLQKFLYRTLLQLGLPFLDCGLACNETFRNIYLLY
jgi:hypothetical protein